ncbi:DUF4293 domain-containing protein [Pedobacter sp. Leaf132]|uniref:DUF4293 domain-containing protein n=1 Tax=Pedobacter sp. Leaf132 TaxID=2876557 RepID=UPI001E46A72E|nr:DUF4293 domain-containing protein [Pedobacter sp. Leaf132]
MIQRIQSIWLFLATLTLILMLFLPIATKTVEGNETAIYIKGMQQSFSGDGLLVKTNIPMLTTNITLIVICFINIFNFRKRSLQKRVIIFTIAAIIGFAFWCGIYIKQLPGGIEGASFGIGAYMPAVAILFLVLAIFGINKDESLIRSAERLR